jgi:hypothetical protein
MSEQVNDLIGWKWLTRELRPIIWPQSEEHPPFRTGAWTKRQPGAGPFSVFRYQGDAFRYGALLGSHTAKLELWEVRWVPCYSIHGGPTRFYGPLVLWRRGADGDTDTPGEPLQDLPHGTCLADAVMLVRPVPKEQVLRALLKEACDSRELWSRRVEYWLNEARRRNVELPTRLTKLATGRSQATPAPAGSP